ncbi:unnamed protein product [Ectocarpus sp. 12 AP-2014]
MERDAGSGSASPGPTCSGCLDAFVVALNATCDGKSWYTSTKELQLASLEFCMACRNYRTLHLKVDEHIPRRLLATTDALPPHPKRLCWTRVPLLRARSVTWNMPTAAEMRKPVFAMTEVDRMEFGNTFEGSFEAVAWPPRLKLIKFGFWSRFNQPIAGVVLPSSLKQLHLGASFNQPIENVVWPPFLDELTFGQDFNQPIEQAKFPASLTHLIFDGSSFFDQPIEQVAWPTSLRQLTFGVGFNQPIERAIFAASLQRLTFGQQFDQPIERAVWPDSLQRLVFGENFNQPVDTVRWPALLQELTFGTCEDQEDGRMVMRSEFNQHLGSSRWPASLRRLTVGGTFRQSLQGLGTWMPNLEVLRALDWEDDGWGHPSHGDSLLREILWPNGLRELTVFKKSSLDGVVIPSTVQVYRPDLEVV